MRGTKRMLLGVCPIGKVIFSHQDAIVQKRELFEKLNKWGVDYCHIDDVIADGLIRNQSDVEPVVGHFKAQNIDALFIPHCNFGTEGAAGMIAKSCGVPVLLWGPRDEAPLPDGSRLRDSLCGTLATSKVLNTLGVAFSYINNCRITDPQFQHGLSRFLRASRTVRTLRTMRIGQIGQRIDFFWTTIVSESALLRKFGIQVLPIDLTDMLKRIKERTASNRDKYLRELECTKEVIDFRGYKDDGPVLYNFAFRDELIDLAQEHKLDGFCVQTFSSVQNELGTFLSLGMAMVHDQGYVVSPESDLHGAISSVLLEAASNLDEPSFIPDITIRHPENDNAFLLWHAEAPLSLRDPNSDVRVDRPWILKSLPAGLLHFRLKDGPLTLCRFDGDGESYRLGCGQGHTVAGPYTQEFYTWMEVDNWPRWEEQLIKGPYIHHCSCIYDHCAEIMEEAATMIPELEFEHFGR